METRFTLRTQGLESTSTWTFNPALPQTIKIGSSPNNQVILADPSVSRLHAVIELSVKGAMLRALSAVSVNHQPSRNHLLQPGDSIAFGEITLVVARDTDVPQESVSPALQASDTPLVAPARARPALFSDDAASAPQTQTELQHAQAFAMPSPETLPTEKATTATTPNALTSEPPCTPENCLVEVRCFCGSALLGMWHFRQPRQITLGESPKSTIFLSSEGLPSEEFPLLSYENDTYMLSLVPSMRGELLLGGQNIALPRQDASAASRKVASPSRILSSAISRIVLPLDAQVLIHWGGVSLALRFCAAPAQEKGNRWSHLDYNYVNSCVVAFFFHVAFIATLLVAPHDVKALQVDPLTDPTRFGKLILTPPPPTKKAEEVLAELQNRQPKPPAKPVVSSHLVKSVQSPVRPALKPIHWPLQAHRSPSANAMDHFHDFLKDTGMQLQSNGGVHAPLSNTPLGLVPPGLSTPGKSGLGLPETRGIGVPGAPGTPERRDIGPISTDHGLRRRWTEPSLGDKPARPIDILTPGTPEIQGALGADIIKAVVDRQRAQVRYCYESELQRHHDLEGRVVIGWVIGATGEVFNAHVIESSLDNHDVEECLLERVRSWRFPPPAGGGTVEVHYPFVFHSS